MATHLVRVGSSWLEFDEVQIIFAQFEPTFPPSGHLGQLETTWGKSFFVIVRWLWSRCQTIDYLASWHELGVIELECNSLRVIVCRLSDYSIACLVYFFGFVILRTATACLASFITSASSLLSYNANLKHGRCFYDETLYDMPGFTNKACSSSKRTNFILTSRRIKSPNATKQHQAVDVLRSSTKRSLIMLSSWHSKLWNQAE